MAEPMRFPDLPTLHERHYGLDPAVCSMLAASARVCLDRHHSSPATVTVVSDPSDERSYILEWIPSGPRERHSLANPDDAIRDGAYCVVLAAAEAQIGLLACARTGRGTGADYYVKPAGQPCEDDRGMNLEGAYRLEVSGIDRCRSAAELEGRVRQKMLQARVGASDLPALAGVVAFNMLRVVLRAVE